MPDSSNADFAEFAATALDAFQRQHADPGPDHRTDLAQADLLLRDLLTDLMHYADSRGLNFDHALDEARLSHSNERTEEAKHPIGSPVRLIGDAAELAESNGEATRGVVTGLFIPLHEETDFYVRRLGEDRSARFRAADLEPAPPFPSTQSHQGLMQSPLAAEDALVATLARIVAADRWQVPARYEDLADHHLLLGALTDWTGLADEQVSELLLPKAARRLQRLEGDLDPWGTAEPGVGPRPAPESAPPQSEHPPPGADTPPLGPAELAALDFPHPIEGGLPAHSAQDPDQQPATRPDRPGRAGPGRGPRR